MMPFVCDKSVLSACPHPVSPSLPYVICRRVFCALTYLKHGTPLIVLSLSVFVRKRFSVLCNFGGRRYDFVRFSLFLLLLLLTFNLFSCCCHFPPHVRPRTPVFRECRPPFHYPLPYAFFYYYFQFTHTHTPANALTNVLPHTCHHFYPQPSISTCSETQLQLIQNPHALQSIPVSSH